MQRRCGSNFDLVMVFESELDDDLKAFRRVSCIMYLQSIENGA